MAAFHEVLFMPSISYGSSGGPKFKTTIFTADSGFEQRNIDWANQRAEYDASHGIKSQSDMDLLTAFFYARRGRAYGFRYKDWNDYRITNQTIGSGDGTTTTFQIVKTYISAQTESGETDSYTRTLTKINWGTIAGVTVGGVVVTQTPDPTTGQAWSVDNNTGLITFVNAPALNAAIIIGAGEFHVPVRFDTDHLDVSQDFWETSSWPNIALVEVRDWGQVFS